MTVALVSYVLYSAYHVFGGSSEGVRAVSGWLLVGLYLALTVFIIYNLICNIRILRVHYRRMVDPAMAEVRNGLRTKMAMYVLYGITMACYYVFSASCLVLYSVLGLTDRQYLRLHNLEQVVCLITITLVTSIFHPCFFTRAFHLGLIQLVPVHAIVG